MTDIPLDPGYCGSSPPIGRVGSRSIEVNNLRIGSRIIDLPSSDPLERYVLLLNIIEGNHWSGSFALSFVPFGQTVLAHCLSVSKKPSGTLCCEMGEVKHTYFSSVTSGSEQHIVCMPVSMHYVVFLDVYVKRETGVPGT